MKPVAKFQCQFCRHEPFATMGSYLGHLAAKHPHEAREKYPPVTAFHLAASAPEKTHPPHRD